MILSYTEQGRECKSHSIDGIGAIVYNPTERRFDLYEGDRERSSGYITIEDNYIEYATERIQVVWWGVEVEHERGSLHVWANGWGEECCSDEYGYGNTMQKSYFVPHSKEFVEIWKGYATTIYNFATMCSCSDKCNNGFECPKLLAFRLYDDYYNNLESKKDKKEADA